MKEFLIAKKFYEKMTEIDDKIKNLRDSKSTPQYVDAKAETLKND